MYLIGIVNYYVRSESGNMAVLRDQSFYVPLTQSDYQRATG